MANRFASGGSEVLLVRSLLVEDEPSPARKLFRYVAVDVGSEEDLTRVASLYVTLGLLGWAMALLGFLASHWIDASEFALFLVVGAAQVSLGTALLLPCSRGRLKTVLRRWYGPSWSRRLVLAMCAAFPMLLFLVLRWWVVFTLCVAVVGIAASIVACAIGCQSFFEWRHRERARRPEETILVDDDDDDEEEDGAESDASATRVAEERE